MILKCEVQGELTYQQYEEIMERLKATDENITFCVSRKYAKEGFLRIYAGCIDKIFVSKSKHNRHSCRQFSITKYFLVVTMNPTHVLTGTYDPLALFNPDQYGQLVSEFDKRIAEIFDSNLPSVAKWTTRSVEYAADIPIDTGNNNVTAGQYTELFRQGMAPERMIEKIQLTDHYTVYNGGVTIRCYPLQSELRVRGCKVPEILGQAEKYVRFEVKYQRRKLTNIAKRYGYKGRPGSFFLGQRIDLLLLRAYARTIFTSDDYYSVRQAVRRLDACKTLHSRSRSGCREMLQAIGNIGGLSKARAKWNQLTDNVIPVRVKDKRSNVRLQGYQLRRRLRQLQQAGVNPVPIPVAWKIGRLKNPFGPFLDQLEE